MLSSVQSRIVAILVASFSVTVSYAEIDPNAQQVDAWLEKFQNNSKAQMNQLPVKQGKKGKAKFQSQSLTNRQFVIQKAELRKKQFPQAPAGGRSAIEANDQAKQLADNTRSFVSNLAAMESKRLKKAKLKVQPWSDTYWPLYQGTLGARYADENFPTDNFKKSMDYALKTKFVGDMTLNASSIDNLSPSEKYDLLIGNTKDFEFTKANWSEGKYYWDTQKKVETWMGICHGWAAAAYVLPRPTNKIVVTAADGKTKIPFYPSDIKALASLLYAKVSVPTKFIGGRCDQKNPKEDSNGRILSQECFDNNPGAFHMAVVNQIGISKRSMVLDATFDYEVWNQPIVSYSYTYFNPQTGKTTSRLSAAKVDIRDFTKDKFKKYRANETKTVVGVAMNLTYVLETDANHDVKDSEEKDSTTTATYMYDLELDEEGNIIGGEWYQNTHPDFLWTPNKGVEALTEYDYDISGNWNLKKGLPESWIAMAQTASKEQLPLGKIVKQLVLESTISE